MSALTRIRVETAAPYDVLVGTDVRGELAGLLSGAQRVAVIHPEALTSMALTVCDELRRSGQVAHPIAVPNAEAAKTAEVAARCWAELGRLGFTRSDAVVGVGGGATTDLAGFVAATFLRGVRVVHLPTSLLGMVDAAVGGKTGINTAEGKNLVGAFHEPAGVLCDLGTLDSLERDDLVSGLAEVVKCGFIADEEILRIVEADPSAAADPRSPQCRELIERAIVVKATVVAGDLREQTSLGSTVGREALNYGHTFAHAIEQVEHYTWRHGDAVSVGMVFVAELARLAGRLDDLTVRRHRDVLDAVGLPTAYDGADWPALLDAMRRDKKTRGDRLRFVVLERVGLPAIVEAPPTEQLTEAFAATSTARPIGSAS